MRHRRILVVDDEKNIRLMLRQALASEEVVVESAINGEEAIAKLGEAEFDVMLLDLRLPGMDGLEVLRRVHEQVPEMPVILLTAHGTIEGAVDAMRSGAVNFLQKPFSPREIRDAVAEALQTNKSPGEANETRSSESSN